VCAGTDSVTKRGPIRPRRLKRQSASLALRLVASEMINRVDSDNITFINTALRGRNNFLVQELVEYVPVRRCGFIVHIRHVAGNMTRIYNSVAVRDVIKAIQPPTSRAFIRQRRTKQRHNARAINLSQ
jgi:hypothetical protein